MDEISIVCAPNQGDIPGLAVELINHCERLKDRFAILQEDQAKAYSIGVVQVDRESKYAATYLPWLKIIDPLTKAESLSLQGGMLQVSMQGLILSVESIRLPLTRSLEVLPLCRFS